MDTGTDRWAQFHSDFFEVCPSVRGRGSRSNGPSGWAQNWAQSVRGASTAGRNTPANILSGKKKIGGREGIRTLDPLLAKQVLSQLSYTPVFEVGGWRLEIGDRPNGFQSAPDYCGAGREERREEQRKGTAGRT